MAHILLIDDDASVRKLFEHILTGVGHEVTTLEDGTDAARIVERGDVDLVITDLIMPGQEGMATIEQLRRGWPDLPIIAISGGGRLSALDLLPVARGLGANATLPKPVSVSTLRDAVDALVR